MSKRILTRILTLSLLSVFLTAVPASSGHLAVISGKVTTGTDKAPVAGVRVKAWSVSPEALQNKALYASEETAEDGLFRLAVPPGDYYVLAEGNDLFAFYGRNPLTVLPDGIGDLNLSLVAHDAPVAKADPRVDTGFLGRLYYEGQPVEGAVVKVYPDAGSKFRGMGLGMTAPTDATGLFEAPLPPGKYFLVARKRNSGEFRGPLQAGDFFGYYPDNPVEISEGEIVDASLSMVEVPEKIARQSETLFGETSISGRVLDGQGEPVAGVKVMLYGDAMMIERPLYVSQPTDEDGHFVLSFPRGGRYWLVTRDRLGGQPLPGQFAGRYVGSPDGSLRIRTGQKREGILISGGIL